MLVVTGHLRIKPGERATFLASSRDAMVQARKAPGCKDFVVAGDPLDEDRVNIHEEWESQADLTAFRGSGPDSASNELIVEASVNEYVVDSKS